MSLTCTQPLPALFTSPTKPSMRLPTTDTLVPIQMSGSVELSSGVAFLRLGLSARYASSSAEYFIGLSLWKPASFSSSRSLAEWNCCSGLGGARTGTASGYSGVPSVSIGISADGRNVQTL
jgi:hypothetical protein